MEPISASVSAGPGIVWFRRDLRLDDNPAWAAATASHSQVVALFILEPELLRATGTVRRNQLLAHLGDLDHQLQDLGGCLVLRHGPAVDAVPKAVRDVQAAAVYANSDVSPFSVRRDSAVASSTANLDVSIHFFSGLTVHEPGRVQTKKGTLSQVFGAFYRTWAATELTPWPQPGAGKPAKADGVELPPIQGAPYQAPGERAAWDRLQGWLEQVDSYPDTRDLPAIPGTSELSADLKFGTIAARTVLDVVGTGSLGRSAFVRQLAWRDWWSHMLADKPDLATSAIRADYNTIAWDNDENQFDRWCRGLTGYPIIDAGMRQLAITGWMHNRVRMICASFLVKDLLIDWRWGERFFRHHLVDADVAQNAGNWQWVAGTGPDAAPYFRVFNPTTQSKKFDPSGDYIRRWVPELSTLATPGIHEPSSVAPLDLEAAGVRIGQTYPAPLVNHAAARLRTLDAYKAALG